MRSVRQHPWYGCCNLVRQPRFEPLPGCKQASHWALSIFIYEYWSELYINVMTNSHCRETRAKILTHVGPNRKSFHCRRHYQNGQKGIWNNVIMISEPVVQNHPLVPKLIWNLIWSAIILFVKSYFYANIKRLCNVMDPTAHDLILIMVILSNGYYPCQMNSKSSIPDWRTAVKPHGVGLLASWS